MLCSVFLKKLSELDTWRTNHKQALSRWTVSESRIFKKIRKQKQQRPDTGPEFILLQFSSDVERPQWTVGGRKRRRDAQLYKNPVESVATGGNEWWVGTYGGGDLSNTVEALLLEEALLQKHWKVPSAIEPPHQIVSLSPWRRSQSHCQRRKDSRLLHSTAFFG